MGGSYRPVERIPYYGCTAQYLHFWYLLISLANLLVSGLLIVVVFILAAALQPPEKQRLSTLETVLHPGSAGDGEVAEAEVRS